MASFNVDRVHHYTKVPGTNEVRMRATTPYVRLSEGAGEPPIFLCQGGFWSEGGDVWKDEDLPPWVWKHIARLNPVVLEEVGFSSRLKEAKRRAAGEDYKPHRVRQEVDPKLVDEKAPRRSTKIKLHGVH